MCIMEPFQAELVRKSVIVPYSDTESDIYVDEEACVGNRGFKKPKVLQKRSQKKRNNFGVKPNPCLNKKCGNSCTDKVSEEDRVLINEHFCGMGNKIRQRDWLLSCMTRKCIQRKTSESTKRQWSFVYTINFNNIKAKVCQQFLLKTLNISQKMLIYTRNNANFLNTTEGIKKKGTPHNKSDEAKVAILKSFITQLPAVPSHYCRNKSSKMYLPSEFRNIPTLYKCYINHLKFIDKESAVLSLRVFRDIFNTSFHIGFHMPKKDKCVLCEKYNQSDSSTKNILNQTEEFKMHLRDKEKSKEIFLKEQKQNAANPSFLCASFDLQKVLNTPHSKSINLFYSRKYAYYNESIYESGTRNGYCFLWGEKDGKRGCNEVCTIMFKYLEHLDEKGTHNYISLYCDSCAGQNRNRAMLGMLTYFIKSCRFIETIKITYLLPGHTMMPVDSIHSTIESFTRQRNVWAPSEWFTIISNARTNPRGYECKVMQYSDFKDWNKFARSMFPASIKISFNSLRSAVFERDKPIVTLKHGYFENSEIKEYNLSSILRSKNSSIINEGPLLLYNRTLKISINKYSDLKTLCEKGTIPQQYHNEYLNLINSSAVKDELAETDEEDTY